MKDNEIAELKANLLKRVNALESISDRIENLILNDNVYDDTIREEVTEQKKMKEAFMNKLTNISYEEWRELLK